MRYLLLLVVILVLLVAGCSGLPDLSTLLSGGSNANVSAPGTLTIDSPDLSVNVQATSTEVKAGRDVDLLFELENKNTYSLENVNLSVYDPCIFTFTGDSGKSVSELKAGRSLSFSLKLTAGSTDLDKVCNLKFMVTYNAESSLFQDVAVLTKSEYDQRDVAGTLNNIPIQSSFPPSPLKVSLAFSDKQPFIDNENYYMYLNYYNTGSGVLEVNSGDITISIPENIKDFSCADYNNFVLNKPLSFVGGRAGSSTCSFTTTASQPMDIKSLSLTSRYKYILDNSISITVKRA